MEQLNGKLTSTTAPQYMRSIFATPIGCRAPRPLVGYGGSITAYRRDHGTNASISTQDFSRRVLRFFAACPALVKLSRFIDSPPALRRPRSCMLHAGRKIDQRSLNSREDLPSDRAACSRPSQLRTQVAARHLIALTTLATLTAAALAQGSEPPIITSAFSNAPGGITIGWSHTGVNVFGFIVEEQATGPVASLGPDVRYFPALGLRPATRYAYRVCAVFDSNRVCSNDGDYVALTTMPPESRPPPVAPPPPTAPLPPRDQALHSPVMKALAFRRPANGAIVVELRWINPWTDAQRINADSPSLERNGVPLHSGEIRNYVDRQPPSSAAYRLCLKNPVNAICSAPVTAGARGVEARFRTLDDRFMMHSGWMGFVDNVRNPEAAAHASFILRPGLDKGENTVSFESTAVPNHYFVNDRGRIVVRRIEDVPRFWRGASFIARAPLGAQPLSQFLSFEAVNERPGHFLRFIGNELRVTADDGTPAFKSSASFAQEDAFVPAQSSRLDTPGRPLPRRERQPTAPTKPICEAALAAPGRVPYNTVAMLLQRCIASKASPDRCERARQALDRGLPKATFQALMAQCIAGPDRPTP